MNSETSTEVARNPDGTLKPGAKLGQGRQKGSKNKATILREAMQTKVSKRLSKKTPKVLEVVLNAALDGDLAAAKMILDRTVPIRKAQDEDRAQQPTVSVTIKNLTRSNAHELSVKPVEGEVIRDAED